MRRIIGYISIVLVLMSSCTSMKNVNIVDKEFRHNSDPSFGESKFKFDGNRFQLVMRGGMLYTTGTWQLDSSKKQIILKSDPSKDIYQPADSAIFFQISNDNTVEIIGKNKLRYKELVYKSDD